MRMRARRSFYSNGRMSPRRIIQRGEVFETDELHAQQLERRSIAQPYEQQIMEPDETPTADNFLVEPIREPEETPEAGPDSYKEEGLPYGLEEEPEPEPLEPQQEPTEPLPAPEPLEELPYNELKRLAKEAGIKGYNRMKKAELIKNLKGGKQNGS